MHLGKGNSHISLGILYTDSGDPKYYSGPTVRVGVYGVQVIEREFEQKFDSQWALLAHGPTLGLFFKFLNV